MTKSDEYREMQISSGQLAAVILALLALCVFIFYLGTRVGMKKAAAANPVSPAAASKPPAETAIPPKTTPAVTETAPVQQKAETEKPRPGDTATKLPPKTETKPAAKDAKPPAAEPKPKTVEGANVAAPAGTFYLQAGALDTRPKGEEMAQRIEALGFRAIVLNPFAGDKKPVYRIRVGPYETKEAAQAALTKLADALKRKASEFFIVKG